MCLFEFSFTVCCFKNKNILKLRSEFATKAHEKIKK
jgi:hypothetical protein